MFIIDPPAISGGADPFPCVWPVCEPIEKHRAITADFGVSIDLRIRIKSGVSQGQLSMVVAPHVDRFAWTIGLEELNVENL